jgi:hypothetical protein
MSNLQYTRYLLGITIKASWARSKELTTKNRHQFFIDMQNPLDILPHSKANVTLYKLGIETHAF